MNETQRIDATRFLGREFLLWLWHVSETESGQVRIDEHESVEVAFLDRLVLMEPLSAKEASSIRSETPCDTMESAAALRVGKVPSESRLLLTRGDRRFSFVFRAEELAPVSVKLPALLGKAGDDPYDERLELLEEMEECLDRLYLAFMRVRTEPRAWQQTRKRIASWVATRGQEAEPGPPSKK